MNREKNEITKIKTRSLFYQNRREKTVMTTTVRFLKKKLSRKKTLPSFYLGGGRQKKQEEGSISFSFDSTLCNQYTIILFILKRCNVIEFIKIKIFLRF